MENIFEHLKQTQKVYLPNPYKTIPTWNELIEIAKTISDQKHIGLITITQDGYVIDGYKRLLVCSLYCNSKNVVFEPETKRVPEWEELHRIIVGFSQNKQVVFDVVEVNSNIFSHETPKKVQTVKPEPKVIEMIWNYYINHLISWQRAFSLARVYKSWDIRKKLTRKTNLRVNFDNYTPDISLIDYLVESKGWVYLDEIDLSATPIYEHDSKLASILLTEIENRKNPDYNTQGYTIEHIMPQERYPYWKNINAKEHKEYLHTIGNLTLTKRNSELANKAFDEKKQIYEQELLYLNKTIIDKSKWTPIEIKARTRSLEYNIKEMLRVECEPVREVKADVRSNQYLDIRIDAMTYVDYYYQLIEGIIEQKPNAYLQIIEEFPKYFSNIKPENRPYKYLSTGDYLIVGLSKAEIKKRIKKILEIAGIEVQDNGSLSKM